MKNFSFFIKLIILVPVFTGLSLNAGTPEKELKIFRKFSQKLHSIKTITYRYTREFSYPAEDYHSKSEGSMYIDFSKEYDLAGFRYQYKDQNGFSVFNNSGFFETSAADRTIHLKNKMKTADFEGLSALYNSIITLRNILPAVITDKTIEKHVQDTLIGQKHFYLLTFDTQDRFPNYLGTDFTATTEKITFYNKLVVGRKSFLPVGFIQLKKGSQDINRTAFSDIVLNPAAPAEDSWYYSTYLRAYRPEEQSPVKMISVGQKAPDFTLDKGAALGKVSLNEFKGKLVLLEFWIRNCSYCIHAVPELNKLNSKYGSSKFKLLAVNTTDSRTSIDQFITRHQVNYEVLSGDEQVNRDYGISAFPQMVLIDKKGDVIYSGDLNISVLDALIRANL
jgi:peroxiredoxin